MDRFAGTGAIEKSVTRTYTWIHTEFRSFSKLIAVDGARYDRRYLESQDKVIRRSIAADEQLSPGKKQARRDEMRREREREMQAAIFRNLLEAFRFSLLREETVNGSETLVLDYKPKTGFKPPSLTIRLSPEPAWKALGHQEVPPANSANGHTRSGCQIRRGDLRSSEEGGNHHSGASRHRQWPLAAYV